MKLLCKHKKIITTEYLWWFYDKWVVLEKFEKCARCGKCKTFTAYGRENIKNWRKVNGN